MKTAGEGDSQGETESMLGTHSCSVSARWSSCCYLQEMDVFSFRGKGQGPGERWLAQDQALMVLDTGSGAGLA